MPTGSLIDVLTVAPVHPAHLSLPIELPYPFSSHFAPHYPLVFFPQRNPNIRMENIKLLLIVKALFFFI